MAEIQIRIEKDGTAKVEAFGYTGPSCAMVTAPFINALGIRTGELPKSEMFEENQQTLKVGQ
jgi:Protein of unknown function (DUF2997)